MQIDFNPTPATGDMAKAEMPPPGGHSRSSAPLAAGGRAGSGSRAAVARREDFRETMDDLLRAEASSEAEGRNALNTAKASGEAVGQDSGEVTGKGSEEVSEEASEEASEEGSEKAKNGQGQHPEGTLLEIAAQTTKRLQTGSPAGGKDEGGPVPQGKASSKGDLPQGDPDLERAGDSAKTPSPRIAGARGAAIVSADGEADPAAAGKAAVAENAPGGTSAAQKTDAPLSRQAEARALRNDSPAQAGVPKAGAMPGETVADDKAAFANEAAAKADRSAAGPAAFPKGAETTSGDIGKGLDGGHRLSPTATGVEAKAGPLAEADPSAQRQNGSDSQSLPKAASTPAALSATAEEGAPQSFASLVESLEKGGGAGKHLGADADTALDTLGPSGARGHATAPSAAANAAKGEAAPTQPLPKEEVVQQIVDSARLRLGSGQSEMRIQLKPEHLGRVRLNIATEQQQVVVKVVADLPMVKELLESNLHHLRTELQGQGLEIHKFDVSVGGDSGAQNKEQPAWGQQPGGRRGNAFARSQADQHGEEFGTKRQRPQVMANAAEGVDYFA